MVWKFTFSSVVLTKCQLNPAFISDVDIKTKSETSRVQLWMSTSFSSVGWLKKLGGTVDHFRTYPSKGMLGVIVSHTRTLRWMVLGFPNCNAEVGRALLILVSALAALVLVVLVTSTCIYSLWVFISAPDLRLLSYYMFGMLLDDF